MGDMKLEKEKEKIEETTEVPSSSSIYIPGHWSETAELITNASTYPPPIAFICGPKNSGKTTFSRYLLNTLLQRYKEVAYLDTDCGQPEFTPPGCLSLSVIDEQTPDLTIPNIKTPVRCLFFGDNSAKRDPETYINYVFSLYDYFITEYYMSNESMKNPGKPLLPLVVNTPGWVKGIGRDMLEKMVRYFSPTHVVQIRITAEKKNLPSGAFWLPEGQEYESPVDLIEIKPAFEDSYKRSVLILKDARLMRDVRIIAYFRQCLPCDLDISSRKELAHALASHPPYEVPLSSIKVTHLYSQVPSSEIFHALNASIVGLAVTSTKSTNSETCTPWCVGLGIVRGIDLSKDILYVLTPVPQRVLVKVDLLLQGFLQIPISLLQVQGYRSPYMSANVL
ncbi:Polynucleotide 5'-hydroxyl-kinase NOL9 [Thalictrum thalictroides]|uniref:Polynucleotide 5'-hydroxyl-kinase NOL9 n=1 Tax=Thalictrum thalictroides TaxID=46969 RepID=A0A7J6WQM7_THATH|nr:Polynucleotide 5'-hydroxyl-kinase NOL9 [Thalictrum thalictroides]